MLKAIRSILAFLVVCVGANLVFADQKDTAAADGSGTFSIKDDDSKISTVTIDFLDDDKFVLNLTLRDGTTLELRGRYKDHGAHRNLEFRHGLAHDDIKGSGEVTLSDNRGRVKEVSGSGRAGGDAYSFDFNASRGGGGQWNGGDSAGFSFSEDAQGTGRVDIGEVKSRLTDAKIHMSRNGDFSITASGPEMPSTEWEGRWSGTGPQYSVDLRNQRDLKVRASGTITLTRNNRHFKSIEVSGKEDGEFFQLSFETASRNDDGDGDTQSFSFSDSIDGTGRVDLGDGKDVIEHARIRMSRNGNFSIRAEGPAMDDTEWTGTWSGTGPEYTVELRDSEGTKVRASGTIKLSKDLSNFKHIEVDGKEAGDFFHLYFEREKD